jgi:hypothetical protein
MLTINEWREAIADMVTELFEQSQRLGPPVDAIRIARSLGAEVVLDGSLAGRGRIKRISGCPTLFLRPDDRPERLQWAAAHELGEALAVRLCRRLGRDEAEVSPQEREDIANRLAREILLPYDWFRCDCHAFEFDLVRLKQRYRTASHELIAWRWLDLESPAVVTVFDHGQLTRRRGNGSSSPPPLTDVERRCWERLRQTRQSARTEDSRLSVRGWCVDTPGWEREILYAAVGDDDGFDVET